MYDYVIVGGGPAGLTLATELSGKIAVLERRPVLGGCHRYDSVTHTTTFIEHGPRVYSGAYVNVANILKKIGTSWDEIFQPIVFSPEDIDGKRWYQWLSLKEITVLTFDYLVFALCNKDHGKDISMKTYGTRRGFSETSMAYIDLVCRFSDGAGADRYSLWEFVSGFDQHLSSFYAPRRPTDVLFQTWHDFLKRKNVDVFVSTNATSVTSKSVTTASGKILQTKKVILCIPPLFADRVLKNSKLQDSKFRDFATKTKYEMYWSVSFFGATYAKQRTTPWGIVAVQYPFGVVSAAASIFHTKSPVTGKTLAQTKDPEDAAKEIRRQLGFADDVTYAYETGKYNDQAFVAAAKRGHFPAELANGIAVVGCHNGKSTYNFTSMESAVQNALVYAKKTPQSTWDVSHALRLGLLATAVVAAVRSQSR
jgi:protoporphyrinogen oxidase